LYKILDEKKKSELSTRGLYRDEETKFDNKSDFPKSALFSGSKSHAKFNVNKHI